jgi:hypothetical protein
LKRKPLAEGQITKFQETTVMGTSNEVRYKIDYDMEPGEDTGTVKGKAGVGLWLAGSRDGLGNFGGLTEAADGCGQGNRRLMPRRLSIPDIRF